MSELTPAETILAAGKLLANPARWCQGALARTAKGSSVDPTSKRARAWDLAGVTYHVVGVKPTEFKKDYHKVAVVGAVLAELQVAAQRLYGTGYATVNDRMGHEQVMDVLRHAYRKTK